LHDVAAPTPLMERTAGPGHAQDERMPARSLTEGCR